MEILTNEQGKTWLYKNKFPAENKELRKNFKHLLTYYLVPDSGKRICLARVLRQFLEESKGGKNGVFWLTDWSVFPSCENPNLFYAYRKSLNETRTIIDAPFHLFRNSELDDIECLLDLTLLFFWDATLISSGHDFIVMPSHDEYIDVICKNSSEIKKIEKAFNSLGLKKMKV